MVELTPGVFVEFDGLPGVVVATDDAAWVPEDHLAVWFGDPRAMRKSRGGRGAVAPEVWIVPIDACGFGVEPMIKH